MKRIFSGIMLVLLLIGMLNLAFSIQPLKVYAANSLSYPENHCLSFDGADDYASVMSSVYQTQELTIELWIAPEYTIENGSNSAYGPKYGAVLSYTETWASQGGWALCFNFSDGHLFFRYRYAYSVWPYTTPFYETNTVYTNRAVWNSSSWYHIAVTYSPTTLSLVFYVNKTVDKTYVWTDVTQRLAYESASLKTGGDLTYGYMFKGLIDEVRLWNVSRTHSEIGSDWDRVLNITECAKPELVGYWRFDEGAGLETKDFSSQGNNAILGLAPFNPTWVDFGAPITPEAPPPPKFILVPSEGWQNKELFVPTWRRSTEYPGKVVFEIFNKRDMWYLVKVYKRMPDKTWLEIIPDEFLSITGPYLGPYSVKTFIFPDALVEGDEIKIEVWNDLNDNALCSLWSLDIAVRALLGVSISPQITSWEEMKTKLLTFYNGYMEAIGNLRLGKWKLGLLQFCKALVGSAASREFAELIKALGIETTAAKIATIAFKIVSMIFWLIPNVPVWWHLFENANREPFVEDVTFTVKGTGTELPNLKVIKGLTIVQDGPYYVGETISAQFTIKNEGASQANLSVLTVGGRGPRGDVQDFTFRTNITINSGESYTYEGELKLLYNGTYHFFVAYQTTEGEWVANVPADAGATNSLDIDVLIPTTLIGAELCSPGELRVYDSQGRVTGLVNGEEMREIPRSFYFDGMVVIYDPNDSYKYQVKGIMEGVYNVTIGRFDFENATIFEAVGIPIDNNSLHQFTCDWESLFLNEEGVMVCIDSDGDNLFEKAFTSDSELTFKEFMFPANAIFTFNALWEGVNYPIIMFTSKSTITGFNFSQPQMQIRFELSGETGTSGYCNITIPKNLLKGEPWIVKINGTSWNFQSTSNETHSFIYFNYTFASTLQITIQGTWVVPEFPSALILPLFVVLSMLLIAITKQRFPKKPKRSI